MATVRAVIAFIGATVACVSICLVGCLLAVGALLYLSDTDEPMGPILLGVLIGVFVVMPFSLVTGLRAAGAAAHGAPGPTRASGVVRAGAAVAGISAAAPTAWVAYVFASASGRPLVPWTVGALLAGSAASYVSGEVIRRMTARDTTAGGTASA